MLICKYNIADITENELNEWFNSMSAERRDETMRLVGKDKRASKIAADRLCRKAISEFCGILPQKIEFAKNEFGKPFAKNLPVHFSISHSGDMVICAVSEKEIGIDIEKIRPFNPRAAEKFATEKEIEYINSSKNGFFEIWTLKEAYFKCIGTGLGADIKDVSFSIMPSEILCSENGYKLSFYDAESGYICAICQKSAELFYLSDAKNVQQVSGRC